MVLDAVSNFVRGTADAEVGTDDTTVSVADASIFPDPETDGEFNVVIWDANSFPRPDQDGDVEILRVTERDTDADELTVTRGQELTSAASHPEGSATHLSPTAKMFSDIESTFGDFWDADTEELTADVNNTNTTTEALEADRAIVKEVVGVMQWESGGSNQTVPNETFTKVDWQIVSESDDVVSVSTDDDEIEIHEPGTYSINSWVIWLDDSGWTTGDRSELRVFINGSQIHQSRQLKVGEGVQGVRTQPSVRRLSAGDVIDVRVFQDSGSDQQLFTGSGSADEFAQFEVIRHG